MGNVGNFIVGILCLLGSISWIIGAVNPKDMEKFTIQVGFILSSILCLVSAGLWFGLIDIVVL